MKWKKWKRLLKKDKKAAIEVLVDKDWGLSGTEPLDYGPENLAEEILALHSGELRPYCRMSRKQLLKEGRRVFEIEDDEGSSSSVAATEPTGA